MDSGGLACPRRAVGVLGASTATDPAGDADSESEGLETMTTPTMPINLTDLEDASAERWRAEALAPARRRAQDAPTADAVARMRERILAETNEESEKKHGKIAA